MSAESEPTPVATVPPLRPRRALLPEGFIVTIDGRPFRLEMRTVISGNAADIAAIKLKELE